MKKKFEYGSLTLGQVQQLWSQPAPSHSAQPTHSGMQYFTPLSAFTVNVMVKKSLFYIKNTPLINTVQANGFLCNQQLCGLAL